MSSTSDNLPARPAARGPLIPTGADALAAKAAAATARTDIARRVAGLEQATAAAKADLEAQRRALEVEFAARKAELEAQLAPMRQQLAQMTEVAWSIDLYLGRDEDLTLVRDGAPAPASTPITIRQKVLVMAEESLLLFDQARTTGMDHRDINTWLRWLTADPAHLAALKLTDPLHPRDVWGLVHHALATGHRVVGATLAELFEHAGQVRVHAHYHRAGVERALARWGHVVFPDPEPAP